MHGPVSYIQLNHIVMYGSVGADHGFIIVFVYFVVHTDSTV